MGFKETVGGMKEAGIFPASFSPALGGFNCNAIGLGIGGHYRYHLRNCPWGVYQQN